ncbi:hypothetical protein PVAP13_3KG060600 [Panicum virgatum]|nr:hypothetical protein PVAP13_3KG060600 [Panicum virgatum]KAG2623430.1 hypothetical protein PVAP13_3KG060600 [Panicum virgatum]
MAKATKLFLGSVVLLLYSGPFIQGATGYGDVVEHTPVQSMKTFDPRGSLASLNRKLCGPCLCCSGNSGKSCYPTKCCILLQCTDPRTCSQSILACNCNNCV